MLYGTSQLYYRTFPLWDLIAILKKVTTPKIEPGLPLPVFAFLWMVPKLEEGEREDMGPQVEHVQWASSPHLGAYPGQAVASVPFIPRGDDGSKFSPWDAIQQVLNKEQYAKMERSSG